MEIVLREWSVWQGEAALVCREAGLEPAELAEKLAPLVEVSAGFEGQLSIRTRRRIGELQVGGVMVRVLPQLGVEALLRLIGWVVGTRPRLSLESMGAGDFHVFTLRQALAAGYIVALEALVAAHDLHRRYTARLAILPTLRGAPDFARLSQRPPLRGIPCRYVELTRDTWPNRVLGAATAQASRVLQGTGLEGRSRAMGRLFSALLPAGGGQVVVGPEEVGMAREALGHRDEAHYGPVLSLARMLMFGGGPLAVVGRGGISGWWLDMPSLFERAATQGVCSWASERGLHVLVQPRHKLAIFDGDWTTYREPRPDMEIADGQGDVVAVVDAKYKHYLRAKADGSPERPLDSTDLYQLAFYGMRAKETSKASRFHGVFVVSPAHPDHLPLSERYRTVYVRDDLPLHLVGVDLERLPEREGLALW